MSQSTACERAASPLSERSEAQPGAVARGIQYRIEQDPRSGARVTPTASNSAASAAQMQEFPTRWSYMDALAAQLDAIWPAGVTAVDAVADVRRTR